MIDDTDSADRPASKKSDCSESLLEEVAAIIAGFGGEEDPHEFAGRVINVVRLYLLRQA
jgi:hypothetical protein